MIKFSLMACLLIVHSNSFGTNNWREWKKFQRRWHQAKPINNKAIEFRKKLLAFQELQKFEKEAGRLTFFKSINH